MENERRDGEQRILGVRWDRGEDKLVFGLERIMEHLRDMTPTKRDVVGMATFVIDNYWFFLSYATGDFWRKLVGPVMLPELLEVFPLPSPFLAEMEEGIPPGAQGTSQDQQVSSRSHL